MKCPVCHEGTLVTDTRDVTYSYKAETTLLPHVKGQFCSACGESLLNPAESRHTMNLMLAFNKQVNTTIPGILDVVHETAKALYDAHVINATTLREFDALCLPAVVDLSPTQIKKNTPTRKSKPDGCGDAEI